MYLLILTLSAVVRLAYPKEYGPTEPTHESRSVQIALYVVSAAHEELVRMVASDPKYG